MKELLFDLIISALDIKDAGERIFVLDFLHFQLKKIKEKEEKIIAIQVNEMNGLVNSYRDTDYMLPSGYKKEKC